MTRFLVRPHGTPSAGLWENRLHRSWLNYGQRCDARAGSIPTYTCSTTDGRRVIPSLVWVLWPSAV